MGRGSSAFLLHRIRPLSASITTAAWACTWGCGVVCAARTGTVQSIHNRNIPIFFINQPPGRLVYATRNSIRRRARVAQSSKAAGPPRPNPTPAKLCGGPHTARAAGASLRPLPGSALFQKLLHRIIGATPRICSSRRGPPAAGTPQWPSLQLGRDEEERAEFGPVPQVRIAGGRRLIARTLPARSGAAPASVTSVGRPFKARRWWLIHADRARKRRQRLALRIKSMASSTASISDSFMFVLPESRSPPGGSPGAPGLCPSSSGPKAPKNGDDLFRSGRGKTIPKGHSLAVAQQGPAKTPFWATVTRSRCTEAVMAAVVSPAPGALQNPFQRGVQVFMVTPCSAWRRSPVRQKQGVPLLGLKKALAGVPVPGVLQSGRRRLETLVFQQPSTSSCGGPAPGPSGPRPWAAASGISFPALRPPSPKTR